MRGSGAFRTGAVPGGALAPRWAQRRLWRAARAVPSLDLNFADSKSLVDSVTGQSLVTFTRASNATFVGSDGVLRTAANDVPRFDHNPLTGESLGLLVEEARTNLLRWSEDSSQWLTPSNATLAQNATTAPDGATTADQMLETTGNGLHSQDVTDFVFVSGTTYTYSVFVKSIGGRNFEIGFPVGFSSSRFARFNLTTGTVQGTDAGVTATITAFPSDWYRCSATSVCSTGGGARPANFINNASFSRSYTGDVTKGIFVWGTQLEAASFPTSYIPTTSATATRSADVASIGSFSGPVGCLFAQFSNPASGSRGIASVNDNSANNRIELRTSGTDPFLTVVNGGTTQADIDAGTISANTVARLSGRVTTDNFGASVAGGTEVLDTSGSVPTVTQLQIGRDQAGNYLNGRLPRLAVWAQPLNTLQALTQ